ncbi:uncharacterized protein LOC135170306 [Diachasmimorpha longicaudata]|uniref:uncharacterized protein LOC135170306 n=1 Tax=Diachasmimorpha longicaudata TaxID=58733 RepID=UPI0030B8A4CE
MDSLVPAKRFRCDQKKWQTSEEMNSQDEDSGKPNLLSLPTEVLIEILSYLDCRDFYSLRSVSERFHTLEPAVWRVYEVMEHGPTTSEVIHQLKRMPLLIKITIECRSDCDDILRQLALTNKKLEKLLIKNCTGTTGQLYLSSCHLTRILERCRRLHTISIEGSRHRGRKFYQLLGNMGLKLRSFYSPATPSQFRLFSKHAHHLEVNDRLAMDNMCVGCRTWSPLRYFVAVHGDCGAVVKRRYTALVTYLCATEFLPINVNKNGN